MPGEAAQGAGIGELLECGGGQASLRGGFFAIVERALQAARLDGPSIGLAQATDQLQPIAGWASRVVSS